MSSVRRLPLLLAAACGFDSGGVSGSATASVGSADDGSGSSSTADPTTATLSSSTDPTSATGDDSAATTGDDTGDDTSVDTSDGSVGTSDTGCEPTLFHADVDGDGYGDPNAPIRACEMPGGSVVDATDCNDGDPGAHPGATELCNGVDDDCDTALDEWSTMNATCNGCFTAAVGTDVFYACPGVVTWDAARMDCQIKGAEIATITSATDDAIANALAGSLVFDDVWIGLRRPDFGAAFAWQDGAPVTYTNWRVGAPDTTGAQFACAELDTADSGLWNDVDCSDGFTTGAWLCRGPQ